MNGTLIGFFLAFNDVLSFTLAKQYFLRPLTAIGLWLPTLLYSAQLPLFYYGLKNTSMVDLNIVWNLFSNVIVTFIGLYYFKEKINNIKLLAIFFAFSSIILFSIQKR